MFIRGCCFLIVFCATFSVLSSVSEGNDKTFTNSIGMKLIKIPAGEFMMGSPASEEGRRDDEQQHRVRITKPFFLGVYEVTQEQYERVMGRNPSHYKDANLPVEGVTWEDAVAFCFKLSRKEGKTYRLPTEAEWEYACRAGTTTVFHYGDSLSSWQANFNGKLPYGGAAKGPYLNTIIAVGSYKPNAWGLYDMYGNVSEWCQDGYDSGYYDNSPVDDPPGPSKASRRVYRGGSWVNSALYCRSADRRSFTPRNRSNFLGFRVSLDPPGK